MQIDRILDQLTHYDRLPVEAMRAADADREAVLPVFLRRIADYMADPDAHRHPNPLFMIFHILGGWRETSAYRPLAALLRSPTKRLEAAIGEAAFESAARVMTGVFDGDPRPLYDIVLDPRADEYTRSQMCDTLVNVTLRGALAREEAARFLSACFTDLAPREACFVWVGWQQAVAALGLAELKPQVEEAFAKGWIARSWLGLEHFESDLAHVARHGHPRRFDTDKGFKPFGDAVEELSTWYGFTEDYFRDREARRVRATIAELAGPDVNPFRDVGRNQPCPCGSGKKFKKCCLALRDAA